MVVRSRGFLGGSSGSVHKCIPTKTIHKLAQISTKKKFEVIRVNLWTKKNKSVLICGQKTKTAMQDYPYKEECYNIIGFAMEVHSELGNGFLEPVYQEALSVVLTENGIPHEREKLLKINFRGKVLKKKYVADFVCYNSIILELKAMDAIHPDHLAQVINYLKVTRFKLGLIINFGAKSLQYKRVIL